MKKLTKKKLLSMCLATAMATASAATAFLVVSASDAPDATRFEMVDGASIRMAKPLGLRFMAEIGEDVYNDLIAEESGVDKKMGMFIMPYSYLNDASKYANGEEDLTNKNYANITTKIDNVFYNSADTSVVNKLYEEGDYYYANGVISNMLLKNYAREFVGIAYIAETTSEGTTYTYADFDYENNVRNSTYVAIEAYEDYTETQAREVFEEYVYGAHLQTLGMTESATGTGIDRTVTYTYGDTTYNSVAEVKESLGLKLSVSVKAAYIKTVGGSTQIEATFKDNTGKDVTFNGAHVAKWSSSDENVATVDATGKVTATGKGAATITASFMGESATCKVLVEAIDFENLTAVPDYMSNKSGRIDSFSIVEMNGSKVLQATTTAASTSDVGVFITTGMLDAFFADSSVEYMAFDLKSGATKTGTTVYYHGSGATSWTKYESGSYDSIPVDSFKTYYFPRSEYENWVNAGVTSARFVMIGGSLVCGGESFYLDNFRPVTADEYTDGLYSFEYGGVRTNNGNSPLFYSHNSGNWELSFSNIDSTTAGFTSETVSDGIRAFKFTKLSGDTAISFNHNTDTTMETAMRAAGYVTYDLYVPEGSDAKIVKNGYNSPLSTGWNTVYAKIDATANEWTRFTDTTASTYVFDNIRLITEEEYYEAAYGFESGAGVLRTAEIGDTSTNGGVFYYYGGADMTATFSFAFLEGTGTGDVATVSNPRYASDVKHSGKYSLAFDKGSGYMNVQMRSDSLAYSKFSGGFEFWIYSTTALDGVNTTNFINGCNGKFNGGAGITIPANTWTRVIVTADDMNPTRFLIMQGSWSGTVYIDDVAPITTNTITYNANGGSLADTTQSVVYGENYTLATPTAPKLYQDFLGWYDEDGNRVTDGVWTLEKNITLAAKYGDKLSFEGGVVPTYFTAGGSTESLSAVQTDSTDGSYALKIQSTASGTTPSLKVTTDFLADYFEDENVAYIAFDAKTGVSNTNNFRRSRIRTSTGAWGQDTYESDYAPTDTGAVTGVRYDAYKTFFFSKSDYEDWVNNSITTDLLISAGGMTAGDCIYVDNFRGVTEADYAAAKYSLDNGGVRTNGGNLLMYVADDTSAWQWGIMNGGTAFTSASYSYTNETVSDGVRAFTFKTTANETSTIKFNSTSVAMYTGVAATGYYAVDIYVPEGSDATFTYNTTTWPGATPKKGAWTTVYVNNNTQVIKITDTTGSTYAIDNFRSITEEEYNAAMYGFEANTGGLRDNIADSNVFYYYMGADHTANKYSICASSSILTAASISSEVVHDGNYSLSFTKEAGALNLQMRADSTAYASLHNGFTFWLYTTVAINGTGTSNFLNGNSEKLNGGEGMNIAANTWTQITVTADDIVQKTVGLTTDNACAFLRLNGSTAGTYYIDGIEPLPYVALSYNATVESDNADDATVVREGIVLAASTHTNSNQDALPQDTTDTEDMSYIKFGGSYGLNDFLVFDFTGDNVPIMSFFNSGVTNTIYNQAEDANVKGWIVANGMTTPVRGLTYGGLAGAHANRLAMIGPYKINYKFDDNGSGTALTQARLTEGSAASPSPISMAKLQETPDTPYRMIVGWTQYSDTNMSLNIIVFDLTKGQIVAEYNDTYSTMRAYSLADWEGDVALYGHFGRETTIDALYPIEENTTIEAVVAKYSPSTVVYNGTWDSDGSLTLNQSIYDDGNVNSSAANSPTSADMSYIAFNGSYGLNDYVVFDFTGDNMPIVSFFNNEVTNTVFNNASAGGTIADENVRGWVWFNGLYRNNGVVYGGAATTNVHWQRLTLVGSHKVVGFDNNNNDFRVCLGSASDVNPLSIYALQEVTDTYRMIIGIGKHASSTSKVYVEMAAINMVTGVQVYKYQWEVSTVDFEEGSIALHGQFGKDTVLDKVFGVEEDTTLAALLAKYAKDSDYSDETAVTLDRYAYSSLSDGQWTIDGTDQVTNPTDYRTLESTYTTYKAAGFNILLAQDMISTDGTKETWNTSSAKTFMDNANNAGLKVILTDWHLQILSAPIKITTSGAAASDSTYVPWIIGTDASATTGAAADYLGYLTSLGITVDSTRFATRDALDKFVYDQLAPYKDHPAFYGVMLADEPSYHNAYCYGEIYKSIKRVMPECYVQYNLLPLEDAFSTIQYRYPGVNDIGENITNAQIEEAYKSYVESFLDTMGTDYIQYDDYPMKKDYSSILNGLYYREGDPYIDPTSLRCIQLMAEIAKERDLDVKVVTQSLVMQSVGANEKTVTIHQISEADARWLNNYLLGFGVKQINYFTYWTKRASTSDGEYFVDGGSFVNRDGTTTDLYTFMQTIMADNTKFAPTITHFNYNASQVFGSDNDSNLNNDHISWSSSLTAEASFRWLTGITTDKEYTLVTELYDKDNYNYMYMVMNTIDPSESGTQSIKVTFDSSITTIYVYDQAGNRTEVSLTDNTYSVTLTAGQAVYLLPKL